jgi:hypothetical protein
MSLNTNNGVVIFIDFNCITTRNSLYYFCLNHCFSYISIQTKINWQDEG